MSTELRDPEEAWSSCLLLSRDRKWALSASGSYLRVGEGMGGRAKGGRETDASTNPIAAYLPCTQSYPSPLHTSTHPLTGVTPLSVAAPQPGPCLSLVLPLNMCWPGLDIVASVCADEPGRGRRKGGG